MERYPTCQDASRWNQIAWIIALQAADMGDAPELALRRIARTEAAAGRDPTPWIAAAELMSEAVDSAKRRTQLEQLRAEQAPVITPEAAETTAEEDLAEWVRQQSAEVAA